VRVAIGQEIVAYRPGLELSPVTSDALGWPSLPEAVMATESGSTRKEPPEVSQRERCHQAQAWQPQKDPKDLENSH